MLAVGESESRRKMISNPPRQQLRFQNSYRLESKNPFNKEQVEVILKEIMDKRFSKCERFDSKLSVAFCRSVSDEIIDQVKALDFDRYKIIIIVTACEKFMQGVNYSNKNLWDPAKDSCATYIFDHSHFTAIGMCFAIYRE